VIERAEELALKHIRLGAQASPETFEHVVYLGGSGALDAAVEASAPSAEAHRDKRRFAELQEFSHEAWKKRHGLDA
jgi:hypothetical protein